MARWFLALLYYDMHEYEKAIEVLRQLLSFLRNPRADRSSHISSDLELTPDEVHKRLALTYEAASKWTEALEVYGGMLQRHPDAPDVLHGLLRCEKKSADPRACLETLEAALHAAPHRHELFLPLAVHHYRGGDRRTAFRYLGNAIDAEPMNGELYALAIRWRTEVGEMDEAERMIEAAEEKQIRSFELHKAALQFTLAKGDVHTAFRHLELMAQTSDVDLTPVRNRLSALAAKLSAASTREA
jgi:tetratricopeptide (TPR) repeat protein